MPFLKLSPSEGGQGPVGQRGLCADGGGGKDIRSRINNETDLKVLQKWLKAAARAGSFNNFRSSFTE